MKKTKTLTPFTQYEIKHLLVDLDGTLLDNQELYLSLSFMKRALLKVKKIAGWKKAVKTLLAIKNELEKPSSKKINSERVIELFSERLGMTLEDSRAFIVESLRGIFPNLKKYFSPVPGAKDFLEWAKDHYTLTLATNPVWPQEIVELRLQWAGVDPKIFNMITNATNMSACKPEKEYYQDILKLMDYEPQNCLLIGDKMNMDLPATDVQIPVFIVGKFKELKKISNKKGAAEAWQGSYKNLKKILAASS